MKSFIIFLCFVATSHAGIGVLTPEIEAEALRLWQRYCTGRSEGGNDGVVAVYCKIASDVITESLTHNVELTAGPPLPDNVIFIQGPSYNYKHDVVVSGGGGSAPKTTIFVKSSSSTHEVNVEDKTQQAAAPQKPSIFFLKGSHGGETTEQAASEVVTPPTPTYLPPNPSGGYNYPPPEQPLRY